MAKSELVYLNGELVPSEAAKVSVEDRGFNFADGIYDTDEERYRGRLFQAGCFQ